MKLFGFGLACAMGIMGTTTQASPALGPAFAHIAPTLNAAAYTPPLNDLPSAFPRLRDALPLVRYDDSWIAAQEPEVAADPQLECMAEALYFEARGEPIRGQFAVAEVIINRVESPRYPDTVCDVTTQGAERSGCQFSFACDGKPEAMREREAADRAKRIAAIMLDNGPRILTMGATHFHTNAVEPSWARDLPHTVTIGDHLFYRE
ncbi:cell wall hydrolase [Falsirhodobacter halotolerans]|uniref:cell wall hydrolase n=1 Tax=Falsirhodobacter halotolerans TaxID=1146892 RepID=UPI001FD555B4|nr:cell wall hydrolase [Falsirhodobacter halotolerans]MCJ8140247.1 cell wall hydrolase [Falsirhodobacter halotolerans]